MENGRNVPIVHPERSSINHLARRCILLFILFVVRRQPWHPVEAQRNAKYINRNDYQATGCARNPRRRVLPVSVTDPDHVVQSTCSLRKNDAILVPTFNKNPFTRWLIETCFPKSNNKIKCYELFSMYVGLTSAHTLLDFNRRLVAILRDNITGFCGADAGSS